jgi:hypothetical protein
MNITQSGMDGGSQALMRLRLLAGLAGCLLCTRTQAADLWNEAVNGDLSNNQAAPNAFVTSLGTNSVTGTVGGSETQDWINLTIPAGLKLSSVVLFSYQSADPQGFTGLQAGTSFVGSPFVAGSYLGYAHFGTAASNGSDLPSNVVGVNILPAMGNNGPGGTGAGAIGFTPPLPSGSYTFLIQQTGANTASYRFDYGVTPEPTAILLLSLGGICLLRRCRC